MTIAEADSRERLLYFLETNLEIPATSVTPAGSDTYIQFNDDGALGGDANLTWNKTSTVLNVTGLVAASGNGIFAGKVTTASDLAVSGSSTLGDATGTPSNNELATWADSDTIQGESNLTLRSSLVVTLPPNIPFPEAATSPVIVKTDPSNVRLDSP
jgi:hypothetical protein